MSISQAMLVAVIHVLLVLIVTVLNDKRVARNEYIMQVKITPRNQNLIKFPEIDFSVYLTDEDKKWLERFSVQPETETK